MIFFSKKQFQEKVEKKDIFVSCLQNWCFETKSFYVLEIFHEKILRADKEFNFPIFSIWVSWKEKETWQKIAEAMGKLLLVAE